MPLSFDDALNYTDPNAQQSEREASARALQAGVAASEIYWNHTDPLTALRALHEGHAQPGQLDSQQSAPAIEGTAVEEPAVSGSDTPQLSPADTSGTTADPNVSVSGVHPDPSPSNPNEAIARLRQQLTEAGLSPEA